MQVPEEKILNLHPERTMLEQEKTSKRFGFGKSVKKSEKQPSLYQQMFAAQLEDFKIKTDEEYKHIHTKSFRDYMGNNALVYDIMKDDETQLEKDMRKLKLDPNERNSIGTSAAEYALLFGSRLFNNLKTSEEEVYQSIVGKLVDVKTDNLFTERRLWLITLTTNWEPENFRKFLAKGLQSLNNEIFEEQMEYVTKEQKEAIYKVYSKHNLFHDNESLGGLFGVYFITKFCTLENLLTKGFNVFESPNTSLIYDAKTLIYQTCLDIIENGVSTENMIYCNPGWYYGNISDRTVMMETINSGDSEETVIGRVNDFSDKIQINKKKYRDKKDELVIKWIVPVHSSYGLISQMKDYPPGADESENINLKCDQHPMYWD